MKQSYDRRHFLKTAGAALAATATGALCIGRAQAADKLAVSDPSAQALAYTEDAAKVDAKKETAFKAGSSCANCMLYDATKAQAGYAPCGAFGGKLVNAKGWCRAWVKKPG